MQTWKEIACERLSIPPHATDSHVLDELIRLEINGGSRLLLVREDIAKLMYFLVSRGTLTEGDSKRAMLGITHCIQKLRTRVANQYRDEAAGATGAIVEPFQPPAEY